LMLKIQPLAESSRRLRIGFAPSLSPFMLARPPVDDLLPPPLDSGKVILTFSARHAIWNALKVLRLAPEENILIPSYCCGSEVIPMNKYPVQVKYYRVLHSMEIDLDHLENIIDRKTRAVFVIHYFGFPQKIDEISRLCEEKSLYLIEDCAHCLYGRSGGRWLGTFGDIGVFSLRKTLPVPDGGALVINNPDLKFTGAMVRPPIDAYLGRFKHLLRMSVWFHLGGLDVEDFWIVKRAIEGVKRYRRRFTKDVDYSLGPKSFDPVTGNYQPSWITRAILKKVRSEEVIRVRRKNFLFLLEHLGQVEGVRPLRADLPEGTCPMFFPLLVSNSTEYSRRLQAGGIPAIPLWSDDDAFLPKDVFEDTYILRRTILAIPIHQDLEHRHLTKIVDTLRGIPSHDRTNSP